VASAHEHFCAEDDHQAPSAVPLMILLWAAVVAVGAAAAVWTYQLGRNNLPGLHGDAGEQIEELSEQVKKLTAENERLQSASNASQNE
jgi:hypothetical protein